MRFGKFSLVGLAGAVVQLAVFSALVRIRHWPATPTALLAVEIAVLHNFLWHERFTWRDREPLNLRRRILRLWRFHAANGLVSLAGNAALTYVLVEWLEVPAMISAAAAIGLCAPLNFYLADLWVWGGRAGGTRASLANPGAASLV